MFIFIIYLLLWLANPVAYGAEADYSQFVCRAPGTQSNLCQASDSFTPVTEPSLDLGISNPVNLINGTKVLQDIDVPESTSGQLPFIRYYRSDQIQQNGFGIAWRNNYDIQAKPLSQHKWRIKFPDGSTFISRSINRINGQIQWQAGQQRKFIFNNDGQLIALYRPNYEPIKLDYYQNNAFNGYLKSISNKSQTIRLYYQTIDSTVLLSSIDTALGKFQYQYKDGRLTQVIRPDGMQRNYHYEPELQSGFSSLITGISITDQFGNSWRPRNWQYDRQARVIKAWPEDPEQALEFNYAKNLTSIKSKNGAVQIAYDNIVGQNRITHQSLITANTKTDNKISYDKHGRLQTIDKLQITRYDDGSIKSLNSHKGWPNLQLNYNRKGQLDSWYSNISQLTKAFYHANGNLQGLQYANGDRLEISPDQANRPVKLNYHSNYSPNIEVNLAWRGQQLTKLANHNETEYLTYDDNQNLLQRTINRKTDTPISYTESFRYDDKDRLVKHYLPEGGQLIYQWQDNNITSIIWLDGEGKSHTVIKTTAGMAGYAYGNDMQTQVLYSKHKSWLILSKQNQLVWGEYRASHPNGNLARQLYISANESLSTDFTYDQANRTIGLTSSANAKQIQTQWLAWDSSGNLIAKKHNGQTYRPNSSIQRDASGLPIKFARYTLEYQAQRRLQKIKQGSDILAEYAYNARGQRIHQKYQQASAHRLYIDNRLSAIWHITNGTVDKQQRFIYAHGLPVGLIETNSAKKSQLYYIHSNQIGAPVLVTDNEQNTLWQANYDAFGQAKVITNKIDMPLRLPGQDADPLTGWHDNVFRTYVPNSGQYLEPDPLGPIPGQQAFGYAGQQPLRYSDPLGLVLLAFDGTRNSPINQSNIWKLSQLYNDGDIYHVLGPGNSYFLNWDAVVAASSRQIQQSQWELLMNTLARTQNEGQTVPIDILGYSRGAALARDFANRIVTHTNNGWFSYDDPWRGNIGVCVNLRFMGLFDTVAQFGILGSANAGYDLEITGAWQWVAHAIATNELRALYPLVTVTEDDGANAIEVPFIGAHADIGGGMVLNDEANLINRGDLSDVALNWMYWQAMAALVNQKDLPEADRTVSQPWLHDDRSDTERFLFKPDRYVQDSNTHNLYLQDTSPVIGNEQRQLFERFITRVDEQTPGNITGIVDMQAYNQWLQSELGMPSMLN